MACCKCCCGNVDCAEGQEGKCCCGGVEGDCCQVGEYCCDGVCQEGPCGCSGDCEWQVVWGEDPAYSWDLVTACVDEDCLCAEPADDPGSEEVPAREGNYFTPCRECLDNEDCESGHCCDGECKPGPCCDTVADCPTYNLSCEDIFPGVPELCCDGACEPHACYPGALITLHFQKKEGCQSFSELAEGDPFDVVISGGSLGACGQTEVNLSSVPCITEWTLGVGCEVTDLTFSAGSNATCQACYEFLGWDSCRLDCNDECE
jgi:hypothetical protein